MTTDIHLIDHQVPLDATQCVIARDGVETVATVIREHGERLYVDLTGVRFGVPLDGSAGWKGWRLIHRGPAVRLVVIDGGAK